jgi:hypothetical protein
MEIRGAPLRGREHQRMHPETATQQSVLPVIEVNLFASPLPRPYSSGAVFL